MKAFYCVYAVLGGWETSKTAFHVNNWEKIGLSQNNWDVKMTKSTILFSTALLDFKKQKLNRFRKENKKLAWCDLSRPILNKSKTFSSRDEYKGGFVSKSFSLLLKSPKRCSISFLYVVSAQGSDFAKKILRLS